MRTEAKTTTRMARRGQDAVYPRGGFGVAGRRFGSSGDVCQILDFELSASWQARLHRATNPTSVARSLEEVFLKRFMEIGTHRTPDPASRHPGEPFSRRVVFDSGSTLSRRKTPIPRSVRSNRAGRECEQEVFFRY